jgi:glucosylceramidase
MTKARVSVSLVCLTVLVTACSDSDDPGTQGAGGTPGATGGVGAVGATASGGAGPLGGYATGGMGATGAGLPTGGALTGGAFPTGGMAGTGGALPPTGGIATGGMGAGGSVTGGAPPVGGGGALTGGMPPVGGGGALTGGAPPVGGGGVGAGGTGTGGDATGGAAPAEPSLATSGPQGSGPWVEGEVTVGGGSPTVTVNDTQVFQDWYGFGGTFNEKGWDAMKGLSQADRDLVIQLLFGVDGCNFTYGRIPIGSSDYALSRYSLNETAGDYQMANFSIARDQQDLIPYIKAALAIKPNIRFWASPWSPPTWMKDNNAFDRGNMKSDGQTLDAHALYLQKFVEAYAGEGINIEAVHPQNEPGWEQDYPSCAWDPQTYTTYIADHLGPLFASNLPNVEVWAGTMSNGSVGSSIISSVMGNSTARGYIKGISLQWEMGDSNYVSQYSQNYGVHIMQSEHKCGNYPWESNYVASAAPNDWAYGVESWGFFKNWIEQGVNSYMAWNMVLDNVGRSLDDVRPWAQNALLAINGSQLIITPTYYVFRHLAQFVEPGAVRVGTQGGDALAFRNPDGSIVLVVYNSGGETQMTVSIGGQNLQFTAPGQGWATVNWQG